MLTERLLEFSLLGVEWILWVLMAMSVVAVAVMIERLLLFVGTRERIAVMAPRFSAAIEARDYHDALGAVDGESLVRRVLGAGLRLMAAGTTARGRVEQAMLGALARERARYEARLAVIGTIGNNAPFLGLLGTVLGVIQAFNAMAQIDPSQGATDRMVMGAIGEALVSTGIGILVAVPAVAAFNAAKAHIGGRVRQAEALMGALLAGLDDDEAGSAGRQEKSHGAATV